MQTPDDDSARRADEARGAPPQAALPEDSDEQEFNHFMRFCQAEEETDSPDLNLGDYYKYLAWVWEGR